LTVDFSLLIPKRRGRFGYYKGTISLAGGWFPRPLADLTGRNTTFPPEFLRANVRVALPAKRGAVLNSRVFKWTDKARTIEAMNIEADTLSLIVMDRMEVTRHKFSFGKGVYVSRSPMPKQPTWSDTRGGDDHGLPKGLRNIGAINFAQRAFDVIEDTAALMRSASPKCHLAKNMVMVEIPARDHLVQAGADSVLISDRLWRIVPFERVLSFHDIALAEVAAARLAAPLTTAAKQSDSFQRRLIADTLGAHFGAAFALKIYGGAKSMRDIIGFAAFIPYIDSLIYAPQIPFRETYSKSVKIEDPLRDEPWRFMNRLPRGRRIAAKLLDLIGPKATTRFFADYLAGKHSFNALLDSVLGDFAPLFRKQWFGDYPSINYFVKSTKDEPRPDGRFVHQVIIGKEGKDIIEPVTVRIIDEDGENHDLTWDGKGFNKNLTWISDAPLNTVILDPDNRLVEDANLTDDHPTADNINPLPWRPPLLSHLLIGGDAVTMEPFVKLGLTMRKQFDVTNAFYLSGSYTPRRYGGSFGYIGHFGPKQTLNSRTWYFGPAISVIRYKDVENAGKEIPDSSLFATTMSSLKFMLGRNNRKYSFDPRSGRAFSSWLEYSGGKADDGRIIHLGRASVRMFNLWSPTIGHIFALYGGAMGLIGDPPAANFNTLSSRFVLRGFALDETYGRLGLYTAMEYRHNLFGSTPISTVFFSALDRVQGVLFAGIGTISWPRGYDGLFSKKRTFAEVGYGIRLHILTLGISQYLLGLDFAVPIAPVKRTYEVKQADNTTALAKRNPFKLILGITQIY